MMRFLLIAILLFLLPVAPARGQSDWEEMMQQMAEETGIDDEDEGFWESQQELLNELHEHPIDLNHASREQLLALPFLSEKAVDDILNYIATKGPMRTPGELRLIPGLTTAERQWLRQFVTVGEAVPSGSRKPLHKKSRHELTTRADVPLYTRDGWTWQRGIAHRLRYTFETGRHFDVGLRLEKDAGEPLFSRDQRFYDSYGGHVMLKDLRHLRTLILGDFKAGFGEGLVLNNGLRFGKLSMGLWRTAGGIRPHRSADEVRFLRGVAATFGLGREWDLTVLASWRQLDATINADNTVNTITTTGLHRTPSELSHKESLASQTVAMHATWQHGPWRIGATVMGQRYDHAFARGTQLYRQIYPEGTFFGAASADYSLRLSRLLLCGETAHSFDRHGGGWATLNKAVWRFSPTTQVAAIQRFFSKDYYSPHASTFSENSRAQNESGLTLQADADHVGPFALRALIDFFYSPWPRYTMTRASHGWEGLLQASLQPRRGQSLLLRYSVKSKERNDQRGISHRLRATYTHTFTPRWNVVATAFFHRFHQTADSHGFAVAPRIDYTSHDSRLRLSLMAALFRTDGYDSRLYIYEPSLFQTFGLQQLYGHGQRLAATARLRTPDKRWTLQAKLGATHYDDRTSISSGPTRIHASWKADVQLLLRLQIK
ncbi:MAG: helix-hairpin-helix domain-containing protein [Bacteroidaceae bacterium]|nr:helix-hairpin-helix domain-containing protein [Bacteroidaceae bacterium]